MSVETIYNTNFTSPTNTGRVEFTNVGTGIFQVYESGQTGFAPIDFKASTLEIWTASSGGTQLTLDTDYTLEYLNEDLTNTAGYNVNAGLKVINATYQTGSIWIDCDIVGQEIAAEVINELQDQIDDNTTDIATNTADIATNTAAISALQASNYSGVVNTVHIGKRTSSLPDFLTYSGQYVGIDTNSGSDVLRLNVANSRDNNGLQATIINISADVAADGTAWTIPTTDGFYQLFIKEDATYYVGTLDMEYVAGTVYPTSPSTGDLFFDINDNQMYRYTGSAWTADPMTPIGEAVVSSSVISSVICYAFNGKWDSDYQTSVANSTTTFNHNLGCNPEQIYGRFIMLYTGATDSGYAAGHKINFPLGMHFMGDSAATTRGITEKMERLTLTNREININNYYMIPYSGGSALTQIGANRGDWDYKYCLNRGF